MRNRVAVWLITVGLLLATSMILTGCGSEAEKDDNKVKIGVTLYNQQDTFVSSMMDEFVDCVAEKEITEGVTILVEVYNASDDQTTQNNQVETMINDGCDVICVNLVDRTAPTSIIDMAESADIPIIFFNRELVPEDLERWDKLYYVGADAEESGIMQGAMVAKYFIENESMDKNQDGYLQYIVLEGEAGHQDAVLRTESSTKAITNAGVKVDKLGYAIANWNRAQAQTKMNQLLETHGDAIELVLSNNDDMALGAIDALKERNIEKANWPVIVGIDGTGVGLEAIKNEDMTGTIYNDKEGQAKAMLELAYTLARGEELSMLELEDGKYIRLPYETVWPGDVERYLK